jgi:hypothetical protein
MPGPRLQTSSAPFSVPSVMRERVYQAENAALMAAVSYHVIRGFSDLARGYLAGMNYRDRGRPADVAG